jgi:hypothetical protein
MKEAEGSVQKFIKSPLSRSPLICGVEASFFDVGMGKVPYPWTPGGNHCIVACGIRANGNILVRDYANTLNTPGSVREYDASKMALISATAVTPRWKTPFTTPAIDQQMIDTWAYFLGTNAAPYDTGIARDWKALYPKMDVGSPLGLEKDSVNWEGKPIKVQLFSSGIRCEYNTIDHISRWYDRDHKQVA